MPDRSTFQKSHPPLKRSRSQETVSTVESTYSEIIRRDAPQPQHQDGPNCNCETCRNGLRNLVENIDLMIRQQFGNVNFQPNCQGSTVININIYQSDGTGSRERVGQFHSQQFERAFRRSSNFDGEETSNKLFRSQSELDLRCKGSTSTTRDVLDKIHRLWRQSEVRNVIIA